VSPDLEHLWALHGLDEERAVLMLALSRFPADRALAEQRVAAEKRRLESIKTRVTELQVARRELERDIEALTQQERKFQGQLVAVKKNEEYQALLHEIATTKAKRSDVETAVLTQMEEEERATADRPAIERALAQAESARAERLTRIEAEEGVHRDRIATLDGERAKHLDAIPLALRARYERIHASRDGRAVVAILKGACGGCYRGQPPQILQEARKRDRLLICEGCGSLLILPPDSA